MIGIISDIHGNQAALAAVLDRLDRLGASEIICLGDVGGYYCQINECCETLRGRGIFTLMGNHDRYLAAGKECRRSNSANRCLEHQRRVITKENLKWLAGLPARAARHDIQMVHGGWNDPMDEYVEPTEEYFSGLRGRHFASGHTHVARVWTGGGKSYCNPGSVGQPRDGDPGAAFALWNGVSFTLQRVQYDIGAIQKAMAGAGFAPYFYENLSKGVRIGAGAEVAGRRIE